MSEKYSWASLEDKISKEFLSFLINDKKMKMNTVMSYKRDLKAFFDFCITDGVKKITDTFELFDDYMEHLRDLKKSPATISRNLASLRSFFRFLRDNGFILKNPTHGIKYEKKVQNENSESNILTPDEIDRLILCASGENVKALRDMAILETLYACGLKVTELINLKTDDLHLDDGYIRIENDGTSRYVPIYKGAVKAVKNYIKNGRTKITKDRKNTFLFLNKNAKPLTRQGLWKVLKTYGEKAEIKKEITPHIIRSSMAVHLLENGASLEAVRDILGHKNIELTKKYMKEFKPSVISVYEKAHPKA